MIRCDVCHGLVLYYVCVCVLCFPLITRSKKDFSRSNSSHMQTAAATHSHMAPMMTVARSRLFLLACGSRSLFSRDPYHTSEKAVANFFSYFLPDCCDVDRTQAPSCRGTDRHSDLLELVVT
jgi:hypothetical protein